MEMELVITYSCKKPFHGALGHKLVTIGRWASGVVKIGGFSLGNYEPDITVIHLDGSLKDISQGESCDSVSETNRHSGPYAVRLGLPNLHV